MADHKITDFVDQSAIDGLQRLKTEMVSVKDTYVTVANELVKGLKVSVDGMDQLEKLTKQFSELQSQAATATQRHSAALDEQNRIAANTTNTISRQLMEQEKLNEKTRDAYTRQKEVKEVLSEAVTSYSDMTKRIAEITIAQDKLNAQKKTEKKLYDEGKISQEQYTAVLSTIIKKQQALAAEKSQLEGYTKSEAKENQHASSSYNAMSQELSRLKKAYRELDEEGRNTEIGQNMLAEIKELGAHLKDLDASMGDFQRNVGDYAIACNGGVVVTEDLNRVLGIEAATVAGCIEQNKELEKAKLNLNTADADYQQNLDRINRKMDENRQRILDVDSILQKEATTVAEAEAQNKQLAEALKLIDLKSEGAQARISELNDKIAANKRVIEEATPALQEQANASEGLADKLMSVLGVNTKFGSSLKGLSDAAGSGGNVLQGLGMKVKAFGSTLMGILSNPWVLTFLGIVGVAAGIKWWYEYNKGLAEATKLTMDFTGKTGNEMKRFRSEVQGVADTVGKDFREVLNATDKMAAQLGISFDDALSAIKEGFVANADAQGTFLSNIEKFSPALRDAGLNAREMVAIISQTRSGIFSEDGLKAIQVASDRLKRLPKSTSEALQAIGISTDEMQKSLEDGSKSMMDVIREVSARIKEFPENSEAYGAAIYNVFGRKAAAGGEVLLESLATISTNLDEQKKKLGELGTLQEQQMESQIKLDQTLAAVFDTTGGAFEELTAMAKIFINDGIVKIIEGCVDVVNWFVRLYNKSIIVRAGVNSIVASFKNVWDVCKFVVKQIIESFKALGSMLDGVLTLDVDKVVAGYKNGLAALRTNVEALMKNIAQNGSDAFKKTVEDELSEVNLDLGSAGSGSSAQSTTARDRKASQTQSEADAAAKAAEKLRKQREKEAKEEVKRINDLEEAKLKLMEDGHEKELAQIRLNFNKKIREITGDSEKEVEARRSLIDAMNKELAECERKYREQYESIDLANRLAYVKKGSRLELELKIQQLEKARDRELLEAEKTGADKYVINLKYIKLTKDAEEEYASARMQQIQDDYAAQEAIAENSYNHQLNLLKERYVEEVKAAKGNAGKIEEATKKYEADVARLTETYAIQRAQDSVDMFEKILKNENLSAEDREAIERALAKAKTDLETAMTDHSIAEMKRQEDADKQTTEKRIANAQKWLQMASQGLNAINDLASTIFDAKIQRIEEEQEANTEAGEKEQERISDLVEKKAISEEEGEARKRAAAAKTAKKDEELEKKKQDLQYKQAVWDKANSLAQAGISTALAITQALPNIALAAIAGAIGAIQIATILATPIPKYAKGTKDHPGGLAVVGDGGRAEIVSYGGQMFLTPDKPTLVDMPKGAEVYPDADRMVAENLAITTSLAKGAKDAPSVVVNNDYSDLKREVVALGVLIKRQTKAQQRSAYLAEYEQYKILRDL